MTITRKKSKSSVSTSTSNKDSLRCRLSSSTEGGVEYIFVENMSEARSVTLCIGNVQVYHGMTLDGAISICMGIRLNVGQEDNELRHTKAFYAINSLEFAINITIQKAR